MDRLDLQCRSSDNFYIFLFLKRHDQHSVYLNQKFGGQKQASKIYNTIDVAGREVGIFFQFDKITKTPNSFASHKLLALGYKKGKQNPIIESLFYSYFIEGKDIGKIDELLNIAQQNNIDSKETIDYLQSTKNSAGLLQEEAQARNMGIKGVPCFIINKQYVLFGAQDKDIFINHFGNIAK